MLVVGPNVRGQRLPKAVALERGAGRRHTLLASFFPEQLRGQQRNASYGLERR